MPILDSQVLCSKSDFPKADSATAPTGLGGTQGDRGAKQQEKLTEALEGTGSAEMRRVTVRVDQRQIELSGQVSSYYQKQLAQETVRPLTDGLQIVNQIVVRR